MSAALEAVPGGELEVAGVSAEVAEAVRDAYRRHGGARLAETIVQMAADGDERLRALFDWDDASAAHAHRLATAEAVVRRVKVKILHSPDAAPIRVRAYIAARDLPTLADAGQEQEKGRYLAIEEVAGQSAYEASLADSIRRDMARLERKYRDAELLFAMAEEVFGRR